MIIQLPEWDGWRISGADNEWEIQTQYKKGKSAGEWRGIRFYPALEWAVDAAYERTLQECGKEFMSLSEMVEECHKVKKRLHDAVKKAVKESA